LFDGKYGLIGWLVSQEAEEAAHQRLPHHQPGEDQHLTHLLIRTLKVTIKEISKEKKKGYVVLLIS
jgi:hypothetical protein